MYLYYLKPLIPGTEQVQISLMQVLVIILAVTEFKAINRM